MAAILLTRINAAQREKQFINQLSYLPSGKYLRIASLEFKEAMADLLWLRAVQFMGKNGNQEYDWFYHAMDCITDLDPKFKDAYRSGAITLSVIAEYPDLSIQLLEKGMKDNPDDWQMPFYIGFNYLYHKKAFLKAAAAMERASQIEGRPSYLPFLTARLYNQGGNNETAILFLKGIYFATKDEKTREKITERMAELEKEISKEDPPQRDITP